MYLIVRVKTNTSLFSGRFIKVSNKKYRSLRSIAVATGILHNFKFTNFRARLSSFRYAKRRRAKRGDISTKLFRIF